jgi:hypothetical protein
MKIGHSSSFLRAGRSQAVLKFSQISNHKWQMRHEYLGIIVLRDRDVPVGLLKECSDHTTTAAGEFAPQLGGTCSSANRAVPLAEPQS